MFDAPIKFVHPQETLYITSEPLNLGDNPPLGAFAVFSFNPFLIVESAGGEYFFKIYNSSNLSFVGNFVRSGRGPGECIMPMIIGETGDSNENDIKLSLFDLGTFELSSFNLGASINTAYSNIEQLCSLPIQTVYATSYVDDNYLAIVIYKNEFVLESVAKDGSISVISTLYPGVNAVDRLSELSSTTTFNERNGCFSMGMCSMPCINVLSVKNGGKKTICTDRDYSGWGDADSPATQVHSYDAAAQSEKYLFLLYAGNHIHVFDNDFNFKYDLTLDRELQYFAVDDKAGAIYGLGMDESLFKFDISAL